MAKDEALRKLQQAEKRAAVQRSKMAAYTARLDINGNEVVDFCRYCGITNALRHKHHPNRCVDCGKLYDRWRRAKRQGTLSELRLLKPVLLQRMYKARSLDRLAAEDADNFYKQVKEQVVDMVEVTHKICKQCGRDLSIDNFRKYTPRGTGVYKTTQGHYTICKDCEAISNRAAAALRRGDQVVLDKLAEYYKTLDAKGLPPVTAAAKRVLGVDTVKPREARVQRLDSLMAVTMGRGGAEVGVGSLSDVDVFRERLQRRDFESADEAYEMLKMFTPELKERGLYGDMNELVEAWFDEDE